MGNSRENQNIFWNLKRRNWKRAWYLIKHFDKLTYEDTFMPLVCKIKGHIKYQPEPEEYPNEIACRRCHNYVK